MESKQYIQYPHCNEQRVRMEPTSLLSVASPANHQAVLQMGKDKPIVEGKEAAPTKTQLAIPRTQTAAQPAPSPAR